MKFRNKIDQILGYVLIGIMSLMVLNVLWQVFSRYFLGEPSSFTDELARYLMIWIGILGAAYVAGKNKHVAIDFLAKRFSLKNQKRLKVIVNILIILFCFFAMVLGGLRLVYITHILDQYSPALQIPLAWVYLCIPLSGILIIYYKISDLYYTK
ncbi:TRAP transporter small permease [Eudoraea sp.]|uniref:TRAP transporter small permease n=1 Tax=Eudoraea sp. TaxID=1979955 RepID=UPI003C7637F3